jgi:predicted Na+-dependent transporter
VFLAASHEVDILSIVIPFAVIIVVMIVAAVIFGRWWDKKRKENKEMQGKLQKVTDPLYPFPRSGI